MRPLLLLFLISLLPQALPAQYDLPTTTQLDKQVKLENAGRINGPDKEFSPAYYANGIVFVSRYANGPIDPATGQTFYALFYAAQDPLGRIERRQPFSTALNSANHEGPVCFDTKGDRIFFTRTNSSYGVRKASQKGKVNLSIYTATRGQFDWENVQVLPFNDGEASYLHPTLTPSGTRLFFASDRPGGFGGMDIYFSDYANGRWGDPVNLGSEVNSRGNDVFPFYHQNGTLFFSSDGPAGTGGLDLFSVDMSQRNWGRVRNLGTPFNSPADDFGIILDEEGTAGFLTSNRPGGFGQDDLYEFSAPGGLEGVAAVPGRREVVSVYDAASSRRVSGASLRVFPLNARGEAGEEYYDYRFEPGEGDQLTLQLQPKPERKLRSPDAVSDNNGQAGINLKYGRSYLLLVNKTGYLSRELKFDYSENGTSRPLEILLNPTNCITLEGQLTSTAGDPVDNAYINVTADDCGPVALPATLLVKSDLNGRFELCLAPGCTYTVGAAKSGFADAATNVTTVRLRSTRTLKVALALRPTGPASITQAGAAVREGAVFNLENIEYDFNKSAIQKGESADLLALEQLLLEYPGMMVELSAHTDSRGEADYNLDLSLRRAEAARAFLIARGIDGTRLRATGYGEAQPRNGCLDGVPCTEEQYAENRRTEVKILRVK